MPTTQYVLNRLTALRCAHVCVQIVDCKSFDEVFDLFTGLLDDCALGDPSGQAALFGYFYDTPDSSDSMSTQLAGSATVVTGLPAATPTSTGAQAMDGYSTGPDSEMTMSQPTEQA